MASTSDAAQQPHPSIRCEVTGIAPARADGQYLLGAVLLWANINSIIWQQLAAILVIQSGAIAAGFATRKTITSLAVIALAAGITIAIGLQILRNMRIRGDINNHVHRMVKLTVPVPNDGNEFLYMTGSSIRQYAIVHGNMGTVLLMGALLAIDTIIAATMNFPSYFETLRPAWFLPVFGG